MRLKSMILVGVAVAATLMGSVMTVVAPVTVECIEA